ncbi:fibrinogen-like protein A [Pomacea canaliculata]|uniref:fibrinogen-like protein A n=1 Tax=Pomacea canaliculata TaxID=400727 RepID=UPI000D731CCF|nr:fibrinogen-like protein A [Pomacea canaliculata]
MIQMLRFFFFLLCVSPCLLTEITASGQSGCPDNFINPKDWNNTSCETDKECGQPNALCYMGKCVCQPGFFYSASDYTCTATCEPSELHNTFMEYPDSGIRGHNLEVMDGLCLEDCRNLCLSTKRCLTFDFRGVGGLCVFHDVTARQAPAGWYPQTAEGWSHYHRSCLTVFASSRVWYNLLCNTDLDCPDPYSQCVSGRCLCPRGTHYNQTENACVPARQSCDDWRKTGGKTGVYAIELPDSEDTMTVWCDMDSGNGSWLVFQRRRDGSVDFYRNWTEYEQGFGNVSGEFWLGLSRLHTLTKGRPTRLRIDIGEVTGERYYAEYSTFRVDGPETNYTLTVSGYSGNAGDSMALHNKQKFSTYDRDNDRWSTGNCAAHYNAAWWYNLCHVSHLNGRYKSDGADADDGIRWYHTHYDSRSFTFSEMKMQPV